LDWIELEEEEEEEEGEGGGEKEEMENGCEWYIGGVLGLLDFMGGEKGE